MRRTRLSLIAASVCAFCFSQSSFAAAYQLYELGAPVIGTADVGQAVVNDASASYYNPAAMAQLETSQFMLGSQLMVPSIQFSPNTQNTIAGSNGGNAGILTPGMGLYYVYSLSPKLKFGVSFNSPYGGVLNYSDGWVGRYMVQYMEFYTLALNPSVSYTLNSKFSIGIGGTVEYANLQQTVALPVIPHEVDGQANIKVNNVSGGFNLGAMYVPYKTTRMGLAFRSKISHNLSGNLTFLVIPNQPSVSTKLIMPQNVTFSIAQDIGNRFTLLGELGWADWSQMQNSTLFVAGYSATTPLDWNNTWRAGLGAQIKCTRALMLQFGGSYDSSPTNTSHRLANLPFDRQVRAGAGAVYSVTQNSKLGVSYEYMNFGRANIDNTSSNGVLSGSYSRNYANVLQISASLSA